MVGISRYFLSDFSLWDELFEDFATIDPPEHKIKCPFRSVLRKAPLFYCRVPYQFGP